MRVVVEWGVIVARVVLHRTANCERNERPEHACQGGWFAYHCGQKTNQKDEETVPETYRLQAYNTAKQSENKMHDDTVAKRFGFSGGLVPGVDVMAYMMCTSRSQNGAGTFLNAA